MAGLIAIDPGLQGTGIAIWNKSPKPVYIDVLKSLGADSKEWTDRAFRIGEQVQELAFQFQPRTVICEMMEMHQSARAQMMWKSGDFQRTLVLIGIMFGMLEAAGVIEYRLTPPSEWKGQLPKDVTIRRVTKLLGQKYCDNMQIESHAWDAVGIGLWHRGELK